MTSMWTQQVDSSKFDLPHDPVAVLSLGAMVLLGAFQHTFLQMFSSVWFVTYVMVAGLVIYTHIKNPKTKILRYVLFFLMFLMLINTHINISCEKYGGSWWSGMVGSLRLGTFSQECRNFDWSQWYQENL